MRGGWCAFFIMVACLCAPLNVEAQVAQLPAVSILGRECVRVTDLARYYGMNLATQGRFITMASSSLRLQLEVESREASLNGLKIWLSAPPTVARGMTWISRADVVKTIEPILFPPRGGASIGFRAILIDPGHGGVV